MSKRMFPFLIALALLLQFSTPAFAQLGKKGVEKRNQEATQLQNVKGGTTFQVQKSYKATYDGLLNWVKTADYMIDIQNTSEVAGQIVTQMAVDEKDRGSATRMSITLMKKSDTETTVKVIVYEQRRSTFGGTGSWGDAKFKEDATKVAADKMSAELTQKTVSSND